MNGNKYNHSNHRNIGNYSNKFTHTHKNVGNYDNKCNSSIYINMGKN